MRRCLTFVTILAVFACHRAPTEPTNDVPHGRIAGVVTIGPFCPVQQPTPCPTPPSAYADRKVLIYRDPNTQPLVTVDIDAQGAYLIALVPGTYIVDVKKQSSDLVADLPKSVVVEKNLTTVVNITIDTGIR